MGITAMGFAMGAAVLPPLLQFLVDAYGWRDALRIFSGIMFLALVPALVWLVVDRPSDVGLHPDGESAPPQHAVQAGQSQQIATGAALRNVNFWLITIFITVLVTGSGGYISNMVPFAISRGFTATQGAFTLSCFAIGSFASLILFASIGDRTHPRVLMAGCLFAFALSSFCYLSAHTYPLLLLGGVLHGLAMGGMQPIWGFVTARIFGPSNVAKVYSLTAIIMTPPALLAHPALGRLFDLTGAYDYGFMVMVGLCLAGSFLMLRLRVPAAPEAAPQPAH
jgi:MFS family permease